jgi:hypothetical protein
MKIDRQAIQSAILTATGNPDTGVIRDNLGAMVDGVFYLLNPEIAEAKKVEAKTESKTQDNRIITDKETR